MLASEVRPPPTCWCNMWTLPNSCEWNGFQNLKDASLTTFPSYICLKYKKLDTQREGRVGRHTGGADIHVGRLTREGIDLQCLVHFYVMILIYLCSITSVWYLTGIKKRHFQQSIWKLPNMQTSVLISLRTIFDDFIISIKSKYLFMGLFDASNEEYSITQTW